MGIARAVLNLTSQSGHGSTWWWSGSVASIAPFLLVVTLLGRAAQNMAQTTYPLVAHQLLGVSNSLLGIITATAGLASVVTAATLGARVTSSNALGMLAAGQLLVAIALALLSAPSGAGMLWAAALVLGVGGGVVFPAAMTSIGSAPHGQRARGLAVYALALSIGLVVGPLLEAEILRLLSGSLRGAFRAMLPLPLLATGLAAIGAWRQHERPSQARRAAPPTNTAAWTEHDADPAQQGDRSAARGIVAADINASDIVLPDAATGPCTEPSSSGHAERTSGGRSRDEPDETRSGADHAGSLAEEPAPSARPIGSAASRPSFAGAGPNLPPRPLLTYGSYRLALAALLTYQAPFAAVITFGALLARHADHTSASGASLAFAVFFGVSFGVRVVVVATAPVRHQRVALAVAVMGTAAGIAILSASSSVPFLIVGMAVLGAPHGFMFPMASTVLAEGVPAKALGRANARLMASANLVTIVVPFAAGWLAVAVGYRLMFLSLEVPVAVFGALLASALRPTARQRAPA